MQVRSSEIFIYYQQPPIQPDPSLIALSPLLILTCKKTAEGFKFASDAMGQYVNFETELMCMRSLENII